MNVCAADAAKIDETCKEAVVDGLINNLSARVSGAGDFHRTIYKARPSGLLVSGFLVPLPEEDRDTDEEASPLQINAHGLDFHIDRAASHQTCFGTPEGCRLCAHIPNRPRRRSSTAG